MGSESLTAERLFSRSSQVPGLAWRDGGSHDHGSGVLYELHFMARISHHDAMKEQKISIKRYYFIVIFKALTVILYK